MISIDSRLFHGRKSGVVILLVAVAAYLLNPLSVLALLGFTALQNLRLNRQVTLLLSSTCLALGLAYGTPQHALATDIMPENASKNGRGQDWVCNLGFRQNNDQCQKIAVPDNAYFTGSRYGEGWECKRGFSRNGGQCIRINVPPNAFLTNANWKCERGYRRVDEMCSPIELPENSYLTGSSYDTGWECIRGFMSDGKSCVRISVPAGGYLTESVSARQGWKCLRGYREQGNACVKVVVPSHGYLSKSALGRGWECQRGYQVSGENCSKIDIPEHGHLSYSGDAWVCARPYSKYDGECIIRDRK